MSNKKLIKLSIIRDNESQGCPFGLSIPSACKIAGDTVKNMTSISDLDDTTKEQENSIINSNNRILRWKSTNQQCIYADKLFPNSPTVECNFGDTAPTQKEKSVLLGSPFYSQHFAGIGLDGLYSYPLGFYADYNISRNTYYGIYSLQGMNQNKDLNKIANELINLILKNK